MRRKIFQRWGHRGHAPRHSPGPAISPAPLIVHREAEFLDAIRQRGNELQTKQEAIDATAGLPGGYTSLRRARIFGPRRTSARARKHH
jgi:hypothetical protein